jgi:hypothetical protein
MKRNIYLKKKSLEEAKAVSSNLATLIELGTEIIPVINASGRDRLNRSLQRSPRLLSTVPPWMELR